MITVLGSLNMDLVALCERAPHLGETVMGREFRTIPGGKGANQAIAAARAGASVAMIGAVGGDEFGAQLIETLAREGVDVSLVRRVSGSSGTAHIVVDGAGRNAIVVIPGANGSVEALTPADSDRIRQSRYLLMQLELPLGVVQEAAAVARAAGVTVILTPAPAQPLPTELLANVDWLLPNEHEAETLSGIADPERSAALLGNQVSNVVITLGARGCYWHGAGGERLYVEAPAVEAVDTTAAGDTFTGALAAAISAGRASDEALRWACRAAAISVTRVGAAPSMPFRAEIERFGKE